MVPRAKFSETALAELAARHLRFDPRGLRVRRCPTGKFNDTFFVEGGACPVVLRVAPPDDPARLLFYERRMMRQEPAVHDRVRGRTTIPVPAILACDTSHRDIERDYLLMERLPGTPITGLSDSPRTDFDEILREVGQSLRQVHGITGNRYGYLGEHHPMEPQNNWAGAFRIMWNRLLDDIVRCGGYPLREANWLRRLLDQQLKLFDRPVPAALLHMDVWAENILADERGRLTGLIDWDRALWGDPEIEFAVLDYCGISRPAFWEGYGTPRDRSRDAEVRRVFYLLYEMQKHIFIERARNGNKRRAETFRERSLATARWLE